MEHIELWSLAHEASAALTAHYGPAIDHAAERAGIPFGEWYGWLMAARIFEPDPVSVTRLHVRAAYNSVRQLGQNLDLGVRLGLLRPAGTAEYHLTAAGHAVVGDLIATAYAAMASLDPLPLADLTRLADLLNRLVKASLDAPQPPGTWCLRIARHYDPGVHAPVMVRLDQYLSDLNAFRDDSHLAAWRPLGVSGEAWEALTFVWRGLAATAAELHVALVRRGFTSAEYAAALRDLAARGWLVADGDRYLPSDVGLTIRAEAEALTDRYFYAPWNYLADEELADLRVLLVCLRDSLLRTLPSA